MPDHDLHQRLAQLPRIAAGLPVPHISRWSSEVTAYVRDDPILTAAGWTGVAVFHDGAIGEGVPDLGNLEPSRQRRSALLCRCQVCDVELAGSDGPEPSHPLWLVDLRPPNADTPTTVQSPLGTLARVDAELHPVVYEPWTCADCLAFALAVCPGLLRIARSRGALRLLSVKRAEVIPLAWPAVESDLEVCGFVHIAAVSFDVIDPEDFLRAYRTIAGR